MSNQNLKLEQNCYLDERLRNYVSYDILRYGLIIMEKAKIINEFEEFKNQKHNPNIIMGFVIEYLVDSIKIVLCFENYMKSRLLDLGYYVHIINDKKISKIQSTSPIKIDNSIYNVEILKQQTIGLSELLKPNYYTIIGIDIKIVEFLNELKSIRNKLHFAISGEFIYSQDLIDKIELLIQFRNNIMIPQFNDLAKKYGLKGTVNTL